MGRLFAAQGWVLARLLGGEVGPLTVRLQPL